MVTVSKEVEATIAIYYVKTGLFEGSTTKSFNYLSSIPDLGYTTELDWNKTDTFLVLPENNKIVVREVPQRSGGVRYAFDQMENGQSIVFKPSCISKRIENTLISGKIGTVHSDDFSKLLYSNFKKAVKSNFEKHQEFYLGSEALTLVKSGWKLTTNANLSEEFDLSGF